MPPARPFPAPRRSLSGRRQKPLLSVKTSGQGLYHFIGVRPADYDLTVDATGFVKAAVRGITVDAARETSVPAIKLQVAHRHRRPSKSPPTYRSVEISSAEISGTISTDEIRNLPILDRDPLGRPPDPARRGLQRQLHYRHQRPANLLFRRDPRRHQHPGQLHPRQRPRLHAQQAAHRPGPPDDLVSSNANAAAFGGATETAFSTPSGTNQFHGEALLVQPQQRLLRQRLVQQPGRHSRRPSSTRTSSGGSIGGPIRKDKLFFYTNYEAVRAHQQTPVNATILTASARSGIFTYNDTAGTSHRSTC